MNRYWNLLTDDFKEERYLEVYGNNYDAWYNDYVNNWWESVEWVEIGDIYTVSQTQSTAIVYAELAYYMKSGEVVQHPTPYFHLVFDTAVNQWFIDDTSEESP